MSAIATTWLIKREELDELVAIARTSGTDDVWSNLFARPDTTLDWSGWVMARVLNFLDERDVPLMTSSLQAEADALSEVISTVFVMTPESRSYLAQLDADAYTDEELLAYLADGGGIDSDSLPATRDALRMLHDGIAALADDEVLLLSVG